MHQARLGDGYVDTSPILSKPVDGALGGATVLRYVKGTLGEGLGYSLREDIAVWGYIDASYGSDAKKGRCGYVFLSGGAGVS